MASGRTQRTAAETPELVLEVAHELFYWRGIRVTGVDLVAAEAGIAPTTLHRLFALKDDLVAACLERAANLSAAKAVIPGTRALNSGEARRCSQGTEGT